LGRIRLGSITVFAGAVARRNGKTNPSEFPSCAEKIKRLTKKLPSIAKFPRQSGQSRANP
jgi:hypothetical protein